VVSSFQDVQATIAASRDVLKRHHVRDLFVFGSFARDEAGPDSDVDLLVDFEGPPTFDAYMELKFALEDRLGRPVDLATRDSLRRRLRPLVEREARRVA